MNAVTLYLLTRLTTLNSGAAVLMGLALLTAIGLALLLLGGDRPLNDPVRLAAARWFRRCLIVAALAFGVMLVLPSTKDIDRIWGTNWQEVADDDNQPD